MKNKMYFNLPQIYALTVDAPEYWGVLGRGTGKTEGILAPRIARRIIEMPRSTRVLIAATFQQILTRTLPPLVAGWERLGYKNGVHFLIGQKPTERWKKKWGWQGPYRPPFHYEHVIIWWNGAVQQMVSQDRVGSTNGMSLDGIEGDEAKLLNRERLNSETFPANRGVIRSFANNPHHHGLTFTTDMPVGTGGRWILEKDKDCDQNRIKEIAQLTLLRNQLLLKLKTNSERSTVRQNIAMLDWKIQQLKSPDSNKGALVHYQEASTLENLHALGIPFIRQMMRNLSKLEFTTSILNRKPTNIEDGFYPDLNEEHHGYFSYDYHTFYQTGYDFQKLKETDGVEIDADYSNVKPLHISLDYNRAICPMVVAQINGDEIRCINGIHSLYPKKLKDTLDAFCKYYKNHKKRILYYWYDHTATSEYAHAGRQSDEVVNYLRANDWIVIEKYIGQALGHERRYTMYGHLFNEDEYYSYKIRFNRERCKYLLLSMNQAPAEYKKNGFGKSKKTELDKNFPQEESTHYSEALDMLTSGLLESGLGVIDLIDESGVSIDYF